MPDIEKARTMAPAVFATLAAETCENTAASMITLAEYVTTRQHHPFEIVTHNAERVELGVRYGTNAAEWVLRRGQNLMMVMDNEWQ